MGSLFSDLTTGRPEVLLYLGIGSVITFIGSLILLPYILIRIPPDYFIHTRKERHLHPARVRRISRMAALIVKNLIGGLFLLMGLIMLFTPGQGLLTILAGVLMTNFPGKRKMEIRIISNDSVYHGINAIRRKAHREPLLRPDKQN